MNQLQLFLDRDRERILLECGCPAVDVRFGRRKLDRPSPAKLQLAFATTTASRVIRRDLFRGHPRRRRESPLPLGNDPHAEAEALLIGDEGNLVGLVAPRCGDSR